MRHPHDGRQATDEWIGPVLYQALEYTTYLGHLRGPLYPVKEEETRVCRETRQQRGRHGFGRPVEEPSERWPVRLVRQLCLCRLSAGHDQRVRGIYPEIVEAGVPLLDHSRDRLGPHHFRDRVQLHLGPLTTGTGRDCPAKLVLRVNEGAVRHDVHQGHVHRLSHGCEPARCKDRDFRSKAIPPAKAVPRTYQRLASDTPSVWLGRVKRDRPDAYGYPLVRPR